MIRLAVRARVARLRAMDWLGREATVAKPGFNRWLVPPAAIAVHMCIGQVYAFSVFNKPLAQDLGVEVGKVNVSYQIALFMLGMSAAFLGKWVERTGPRRTMLAACLCFCGGLAVTALAVRLRMVPLVWLGYGVLGGTGLGLGYIAPVSTLVKWFPDRPGMATGMAIMGFGGGALIASPLAQELMRHFGAGVGTGAFGTLLAMAGLYACFMVAGAVMVRVPAAGWVPDGHVAPGGAGSGISAADVAAETAVKTRQFWLLWMVLCMNVSAGIGILGRASDMCQDMFGVSVAVGAGFAGLLSIFNMGGRFFWSSVSDYLGRRLVFSIFFLAGGVLYGLLPWAQATQNKVFFVASTAVIISMYGGGFATMPAYLRDLFGSRNLGVIYGRLITAWSIAAVLGPGLLNGLYDRRVHEGVSRASAYNNTFYLMIGLLGAGLVCNLLVRPVDAKHHLPVEGGAP